MTNVQYGNNTKDFNEDQYIVLENVNDKLKGRYYGTSDDFHEAREGKGDSYGRATREQAIKIAVAMVERFSNLKE